MTILDTEKLKYTNRLSAEKSPYLLQHANNPVGWYPWGEEAFEKAEREDKPIFLSIGYSTCHWCHVMERESFEDMDVANILNESFVSIKVDREERPDIDAIYMTVCQMMTKHGGWPLTILMTPDKKPFYAATYLPKNDRMGMLGLTSLLKRINRLWNEDREVLLRSSEEIVEVLNQSQEHDEEEAEINAEELIQSAFYECIEDFDKIFGGFGSAPKFPIPHTLCFLLRYWYMYKDRSALKMVEKTLNAMDRGGIYDHIGGGFCRYSTDDKWLVPHFEKMLYDNALLSIAYLEAYQVTKKKEYAEVAQQIFAYILRDMTGVEGGFYSAEDADSEGEEGKFYVWSVLEIKELLGEEEGEKYCKFYDITEEGNFEGVNIPNLIQKEISEEERNFLEQCRKKVFEAREKRVHPYKDDKILTAWNGLMIAALAIGGRILQKEEYICAAKKAVEFILSKLTREDGRLLARYRDGDADYLAYAQDYAFLIWGLIELYETTYKPCYLDKALELNKDLIRYFWDEEKGGLFLYGSDSETLIARPKESYDGATPSENSVATLNFLRLARWTGQHELEEKAQIQFDTFKTEISRAPHGYSFFLIAMLFSLAPTREIILVEGSHSSKVDEMIKVIREEYRPFTISMLYSDENKTLKNIAPFINAYENVESTATAYICENFTCQEPIIDVDELKRALNREVSIDKS